MKSTQIKFFLFLSLGNSFEQMHTSIFRNSCVAVRNFQMYSPYGQLHFINKLKLVRNNYTCFSWYATLAWEFSLVVILTNPVFIAFYAFDLKNQVMAIRFQDLSHMKDNGSFGSLYAEELSLFQYPLNIFLVVNKFWTRFGFVQSLSTWWKFSKKNSLTKKTIPINAIALTPYQCFLTVSGWASILVSFEQHR